MSKVSCSWTMDRITKENGIRRTKSTGTALNTEQMEGSLKAAGGTIKQ